MSGEVKNLKKEHLEVERERLDKIKTRIDTYVRKERKQEGDPGQFFIITDDEVKVFYVRAYQDVLSNLVKCYELFRDKGTIINGKRECIDDRMKLRMALQEEYKTVVTETGFVKRALESEMMELDRLNIDDQNEINRLTEESSPLTYKYDEHIANAADIIAFMLDRGDLFLEDFMEKPDIYWSWRKDNDESR